MAEDDRRLCGGWTTSQAPRKDDLDLWNKVLELSNIAELNAKDTPILVQTAVASGVKYRFTFADGSTVTVYQSWTKNTLEVLNVGDTSRSQSTFDLEDVHVQLRF